VHILHRPNISIRQLICRQPGIREAMDHVLCLQNHEIRLRNLLREDEWRAITAPALVIGTLEDEREYLDTARYVADVMPNARYVEMEQVGHWPQFEDFETFNRHNLAFLQG